MDRGLELLPDECLNSTEETKRSFEDFCWVKEASGFSVLVSGCGWVGSETCGIGKSKFHGGIKENVKGKYQRESEKRQQEKRTEKVMRSVMMRWENETSRFN